MILFAFIFMGTVIGILLPLVFQIYNNIQPNKPKLSQLKINSMYLISVPIGCLVGFAIGVAAFLS